NQQQQQAQPQQTQVAHFTGPPSINPASGKLSTQDLFPEIEGNVLAAVIGHTLPASDLYKLDARYRDKPDRSTLELDGTSLRITAETSARDYPFFSYVHQPLVVYFTILIYHVPDCKYFAAAAMLYIGQLNEEYEWAAVLRSHLSFFQRRRREMQRGDYTRCGLRDSDLFDEHLVGHRRQRPSEQKKTPKTGASAEIMNLGASVGFQGPSTLQSCSNLRSAFEVRQSITRDVAVLLANGRAHGPSPLLRSPLSGTHLWVPSPASTPPNAGASTTSPGP
ncbi:hypothetical protein FS837_013009, partial [Tulasnella sp. UAMH 9824]